MENKTKQCETCKKKYKINELKEVVIPKEQKKFFYCSTCYSKICDKCKQPHEELFYKGKNKFCAECYKDINFNGEMEELKEFLKEEFKEKGIQGRLHMQIKDILLKNYDITPKDIILTIKYIKKIKEEESKDVLSLIPSYIKEALDFYKELETIEKENIKRLEQLKENLKKASIEEEKEKSAEITKGKVYEKPSFYGFIDMESALKGGEKFLKESLQDG